MADNKPVEWLRLEAQANELRLAEADRLVKEYAWERDEAKRKLERLRTPMACGHETRFAATIDPDGNGWTGPCAKCEAEDADDKISELEAKLEKINAFKDVYAAAAQDAEAGERELQENLTRVQAENRGLADNAEEDAKIQREMQEVIEKRDAEIARLRESVGAMQITLNATNDEIVRLRAPSPCGVEGHTVATLDRDGDCPLCYWSKSMGPSPCGIAHHRMFYYFEGKCLACKDRCADANRIAELEAQIADQQRRWELATMETIMPCTHPAHFGTEAGCVACALRKALRESMCDGDLCCYQWHEDARAILEQIEASAGKGSRG